MVEITQPNEHWLRISVKAPFAGTRDAMEREKLLGHCQIISKEGDKTVIINWPMLGILNHVVKLLIRVENVAARCSYFPKCSDCAHREKCQNEIAGRK